jgi:hypothetical protein
VLQDDTNHTKGLHVVGHRLELLSHGPETQYLSKEPPSFEAGTFTNADELLIHVGFSYPEKDNIYGAMFQKRVLEDAIKGDNLLRMLSSG